MNNYPLARSSDFVIQESGDDTLIYDLKNNKAVCLNETASAVWKLCDGNRAISEIAVEVAKERRSLVNEDFVLLALNQLNKEGLLAKGFEQDSRFSGSNRREIIKEIGLGLMVALPLVSSIVAPTAISAQSACGLTVGVCVTSMGEDLCTVCAGSSANVSIFSSMDGSCTNPLTDITALCSIPGNSAIVNSGFDYRVTSIT